MIAYLCGKIAGDANYKAKFERYEKHLKDKGYTVINPASLPLGMKDNQYMLICLTMLNEADIIAVLPDFLKSKGARLEIGFAGYQGKKLLMLEDLEDARNS